MVQGIAVENAESSREIWLGFILPITILTVALIRICYKTGEKPRWQWGRPDDHDAKE